MIIEDIKNIKSEKKDLRKFGYVVGGALALFGAFFLWRGKDFYVYFFIVAAALLVLAVILPSILKPLQKVWMSLAIVIGWFVSRILLSVLFYVILTPLGLISRIVGKHFLELKPDSSMKSYWLKRDTSEVKLSDYEKQY